MSTWVNYLSKDQVIEILEKSNIESFGILDTLRKRLRQLIERERNFFRPSVSDTDMMDKLGTSKADISVKEKEIFHEPAVKTAWHTKFRKKSQPEIYIPHQ